MPISQQTPQDSWQLILRVFSWAARIPLACLIIFTAGSVAVLGFFFVFRASMWIFENLLKNPW